MTASYMNDGVSSQMYHDFFRSSDSSNTGEAHFHIETFSEVKNCKVLKVVRIILAGFLVCLFVVRPKLD